MVCWGEIKSGGAEDDEEEGGGDQGGAAAPPEEEDPIEEETENQPEGAGGEEGATTTPGGGGPQLHDAANQELYETYSKQRQVLLLEKMDHWTEKATKRSAEVSVLNDVRYEKEAAVFLQLPFTREYLLKRREGSAAVIAIAVDGTNAILSAADKLQIVACRTGIKTL